MENGTVIAFEEFIKAVENGLKALGLNALQHPKEFKELEQTREDLIDYLQAEK